MSKILILGSTGMLGRYVTKHLSKRHEIVVFNRDKINAEVPLSNKLVETLESEVTNDSTVINCIGMIKPQVDKYGTTSAIIVNSLFPRLLEECCRSWNINLIHITTDCVFSGKKGNYTENDPHDALDVYGKTKSLGEPENCNIIRTSIIGEEINQKRSLVEWVKSNAGKTINGFTNHLWNGVTCLQLAKIIDQIIVEKKFWKGNRHIFSPTPINKYTLVSHINNIYKLNMNINSIESIEYCNRTLSSIYPIQFDIPELEIQIKEMKEFTL